MSDTFKVVLSGTERWWVNALLNNTQVESRGDRRILNVIDDAIEPEGLPDTITLDQLDALEGCVVELTQSQFDKFYDWLDSPMPARTSRVLRSFLDNLDEIKEGNYEEPATSNGSVTAKAEMAANA